MAKLYIQHPLGAKDRVLYDVNATVSSQCLVTFEDDEGNPAEWAGSSTTIDAGGDIGSIEVYEDVDGESALGKYVIDVDSWKLFGPDGPARVLSDAGPTDIDGVTWNPKQFQAVTPGRWLIRVQGHLIEQETGTGAGYNVVSATVTSFTALLEIEDPHVIGNIDGGHLETSSGSIGTSYVAPTEEVEYDADEGWSRSAERYFSTLSKGMSFRKIATGAVTTSTASFGTLLTVTNEEEYKQWHDSLVGTDLVDGGEEIYYYNYAVQVRPVIAADLTDPSLAELPIFISLGTTSSVGDRVYMLVEGSLPMDTSGIPTIDAITGNNTRLFIQPTAVLGATLPSSLGLGYYDRYVGHVLRGQTSDDVETPGAVYFHGHSSWLPGVVTGPLESTDKALVRWDGTTGELIQDSAVQVLHYQTTTNATTTDDYDDIGSVELITVDHRDAGEATDTDLRITTQPSGGRQAGGIHILPGESPTGSPAEVYITSGVGGSSGGDLHLTAGAPVDPTSPATVSGSVNVGTQDCMQAGDVNINAGLSDDVSGGNVHLTAGGATRADAGNLTITAGNSADADGAGTKGGDVTIAAGTGNPGGTVFIDGGAKLAPGSLDGDVLLANTTGKVGVGGAAPLDAEDEVFQVTGDSKFIGDLHITEKLTVDGVIDPIALILTTDAADMMEAAPTAEIAADEGALFVSSGSGQDHLGDALVANAFYYKYAHGYDGVDEKIVSLSTGAGLTIPGPLADSTHANAIAKWADINGDALENSKVLVDSESGIFTAEYAEMSALSTVVDATTRTIDGVPVTTSFPLLVTTGSSPTASGTTAGSIRVQPGLSSHAYSGNVYIFGGQSEIDGGNGGFVDLVGGDVGRVTTDFVNAGGYVHANGGQNHSGTTPTPNDWEQRGRGGNTDLHGGDGNDGGAIVIGGGDSYDFTASMYGHGFGGSIDIAGGTAGLDISGTKASLEAGITDIAVRGGDITLKGGNTYQAPNGDPGDPTWSIQGPSGGDVHISGGDAGIGTGKAMAGGTVREHTLGAFVDESHILFKNAGNHQFHGRGGNVFITGGIGDHTGGSGGITIQTLHSNEGWDAASGAPDYDGGLGHDPLAGHGPIGDITITGADSLARANSGVVGGNVVIRSGVAGLGTAADPSHIVIIPGEPDWPRHMVDTSDPPDGVDTEVVQTGPDAQEWDLAAGAMVSIPWPVDLAPGGGGPPELIGPPPGTVSIDPDKRGVLMVGAMSFDKSAHLCLAATMPQMVVDGDVKVTGMVDPTGLQLTKTADNPGKAAIIANGGDPADWSDLLDTVVWLRDPDGALMLGDAMVTASGSTVDNPNDAVDYEVPYLAADGSLQAPKIADAKVKLSANAEGAVTGVITSGSSSVSITNHFFDSANNQKVDRETEDGDFLGKDFIRPIGATENIVKADLVAVVNDDDVRGGDFDPFSEWGVNEPASGARLVLVLPLVADSFDTVTQTGRRIVIKDSQGLSNKDGKFPMVVVRASVGDGTGEYIDDIGSVQTSGDTPDAALLPDPWSSLTLVCDGERWLII